MILTIACTVSGDRVARAYARRLRQWRAECNSITGGELPSVWANPYPDPPTIPSMAVDRLEQRWRRRQSTQWPTVTGRVSRWAIPGMLECRPIPAAQILARVAGDGPRSAAPTRHAAQIERDDRPVEIEAAA